MKTRVHSLPASPRHTSSTFHSSPSSISESFVAPSSASVGMIFTMESWCTLCSYTHDLCTGPTVTAQFPPGSAARKKKKFFLSTYWPNTHWHAEQTTVNLQPLPFSRLRLKLCTCRGKQVSYPNGNASHPRAWKKKSRILVSKADFVSFYFQYARRQWGR
jgi:hypothetical protein